MKNSNVMLHLLSAVLISVVQDVYSKRTDVILGNSTCFFSRVYDIAPEKDAVHITWNGNALPKNCRLGFTSDDISKGDSVKMYVNVKDENHGVDFKLKFYRGSTSLPISLHYKHWKTWNSVELSFESSFYIYVEFLANFTSHSKSSHAEVTVTVSALYTVTEMILGCVAAAFFLFVFCVIYKKKRGRIECLEAICSCPCGMVRGVCECFRECCHQCKSHTRASGNNLPQMIYQTEEPRREADEESAQQSTATILNPPDFDDIMQADSRQSDSLETVENEPLPYVPLSTDNLSSGQPPQRPNVPPPSYHDVMNLQY